MNFRDENLSTTPQRLLAVLMAILSVGGCGGNSPAAPSQAICTSVSTSPLPLRAGEHFRVKFTVPSGVTSEVVFNSYLGLPDSGFYSSTVVHRLYDGTTLLATQGGQSTLVWWKSRDSTFGTPGDTTFPFNIPAASLSYDSILNGRIDGRVELVVLSGAVTITSAELAEVRFVWPAQKTLPPEVLAPITAREWCR